MYRNTIIKEVSKYLPETVVDNQFYIDHFDSKGIKSKGLYDAVGRDKRHIITDKKENAFTMGLEAGKLVLEKHGISATDIDMLVFVSDSPEYLAPTTALTIREHIGASNAHMVFDMNQNCTGMIAGLDVVSRYMKTNKRINRALLISAFYGSLMGEKEADPVSYGCLSDGASAVILEVEESDREYGVLDSSFLTDSSVCHLMVYPACGFSNLEDDSIPLSKKKMFYGYEEADFLGHDTAKGVKMLLEQNELQPLDVEHYLVSQFEKAIIEEVSEILEIPEDRFVTTMADLGYVGNSSPMFAFEKLLAKGVKEGDKAVISSVGAGHIVSSILYKF